MNLFNFSLPQAPAVPILANLPHSGLRVPDAIAHQLKPEYRTYLPNSDWYLDQLYNFLPELGITVLQATHSRYVVDLNRQLREPLFGNFWSSVVPDATAFGQPLYQTLPTPDEINQRIEQFYKPYHEKLGSVLQEMSDRFGTVYFLDLHSYGGIIDDDVCLGNGQNSTCSEHWISAVETAFRQHYRVVKNKVFTGGWITRHYGEQSNIEALQVELYYPIYLKVEPDQPPSIDAPKFETARSQLQNIFRAIVQTL